MRTRTIAMMTLAGLLFGCANIPRNAPDRGWVEASAWPAPAVAKALGQVTGLDIDRAGRIFAFHRAERKWPAPSSPFPKEPIRGDTIAVLDSEGRLLGAWGRDMFIMPHGLSLDPAGNVWVTDVGAHQVRKFTHDGKLLLTIGEHAVTGSDPRHFNRPTDVAFGPDGTVYISDGYENTRVVRYTMDGRYLGEWGIPGKGPGQFDLPHGIAVDRAGRVYVADRDNYRVQIFDPVGRYLTEWGTDLLGDPFGVAVAGDGSIYVVDGGFQPDKTRARVVRMSPEGRMLASFVAAETTKGDVLGHDLTIASDGTVYVADVWANRIRKLLVRR